MSTGNDPVLPDEDQPQDPNQQVDQQQHQPPADKDEGAKPLTFTHPQPATESDDDDVLLATLEAEAKAEEAGAAGEPEQGDQTGNDPAPDGNRSPAQRGQGQQDAQQQQDGQSIMVPKPRFDAVRVERDQFRDQAAYYRGQAEALKQVPAAGQGQQQQQQQQQQPTPEQRLVDIKQQRIALAKKFDEGEITAVQLEEGRADLDDKAQAIREDQFAAKLKPAPQQPSASENDLYLDSVTARLEQQHPWVSVFNALVPEDGDVNKDPDWMYVRSRAFEAMKEKGLPLNQGQTTSYHLRSEMARLMDELGPTLVADRATRLGITLPGAQRSQQQPTNGKQQPSISPQASARQSALAKAAGAPPDLAAMRGNQGDPTGAMTEERMERISEDEFDALPDAVRNKALGIFA